MTSYILNWHNLKLFLFIITFGFLSNSAFPQKIDPDFSRISKYIDFLGNVEVSAKDYILNQFQEYDIVILAERYHQEETQYELVNEIIKDDYFISNVGNICIEIGSSNLADSLNSFLKYYKGDLKKGNNILLEFQRDISFYPIWNRDNYYVFLKNILSVNSNLDEAERVNLYLCDRTFDWNEIQTKKDWNQAINNDRDSAIAQNISRHYERIKESPRKKLFVILNEAHAISNTKWIDMWQKRASQYLSEKYGTEKIASILINSVTTNSNDKDILIQNGYWDAAYSITEKFNIGFDFYGSPFGNDQFDYALGKNNDLFQYQDIFTGFVFYKPIEHHKLSTGVDNIISTDFRNEFLRRIRIYGGKKYFNKLETDNKLLGWNKKEYYQYDHFEKMIREIQRIEKQYVKNGKN